MTTPTGAARLVLTGHPLQRCGAGAVAELAKAGDAEDVTADALDAVADTLTRAVVRAASAANDAVAYDWWKVLFALYPNSPATHSKRNRDPGELGEVIGQIFAAEQVARASTARASPRTSATCRSSRQATSQRSSPGSGSSRSWPASSPNRTAWSRASPDCGTLNRAPERGRLADAGWKRAAWPSIPRTAAPQSPGTS